jgi:hypothetical protein
LLRVDRRTPDEVVIRPGEVGWNVEPEKPRSSAEVGGQAPETGVNEVGGPSPPHIQTGAIP